MFINQNETDPELEMPTGRAIIFLNAPVKYHDIHMFCWHVIQERNILQVHGGKKNQKPTFNFLTAQTFCFFLPEVYLSQ